MFSRQIDVESRTCPACGSKLAGDRDLFHCKEHGAFFPYGPQLLVRAPRKDIKLPDTLLPWEDHTTRRPR